MICFGIANAISAAFAGILAKYVKRLPIMIGTMLLHGILILWMSLWVAVDKDYITYCLMATIWGFADGLWLVQINCKYKFFLKAL